MKRYYKSIIGVTLTIGGILMFNFIFPGESLDTNQFFDRFGPFYEMIIVLLLGFFSFGLSIVGISIFFLSFFDLMNNNSNKNSIFKVNGSNIFMTNDIIKSSRNLMKSHWKTIIGLGVLTMVPNLLLSLIEYGVGMIPGAVQIVVDPNFGIEQIVYSSPWNIIMPLLNIIMAIVSMWIGLGYIRALLKIWRDEPSPTTADLTSVSGMQLLRYVGATILFAVVVILGLIALVIPGIYISIRLSMYNYLIAEGHGVIDALKTSRAMTQGQVGKLIGIGFYYFGIVLVGAIALLVGLIRAVPLITLAQAGVYNILKNNIQTINPSREHIG